MNFVMYLDAVAPLLNCPVWTHQMAAASCQVQPTSEMSLAVAIAVLRVAVCVTLTVVVVVVFVKFSLQVEAVIAPSIAPFTVASVEKSCE